MEEHRFRQRDDDEQQTPSLRAMTRKLRADAMAICDAPPRSRAQQLADDMALVERARGGEQAAFREMYQLYAPSLYRRILRMLGGNTSQAEDCLQQVFAQALQSLGSYQGTGVLHTWLNRLTTFVVTDEFRHSTSQHNTLKKLWWSWDPRVRQSEAVPEKLFARAEVKEMVHQGLAQLSPKKRIALVLCDLEGYSIEEAAVELDAAPGTIASRLHHGRKELRMLVLASCREHGLAVEDWLHG